MSTQSPGTNPVQTNDIRVTDPRVSQSEGIYHHITDQQRQAAVDALARKPYFSTRPPDPSTQDKIAQESDR